MNLLVKKPWITNHLGSNFRLSARTINAFHIMSVHTYITCERFFFSFFPNSTLLQYTIYLKIHVGTTNHLQSKWIGNAVTDT